MLFIRGNIPGVREVYALHTRVLLVHTLAVQWIYNTSVATQWRKRQECKYAKGFYIWKSALITSSQILVLFCFLYLINGLLPDEVGVNTLRDGVVCSLLQQLALKILYISTAVVPSVQHKGISYSTQQSKILFSLFVLSSIDKTCMYLHN